VHVDARHAVLEFSKCCCNLADENPTPFLSDSEKYYTIDGKIPEGKGWDELSDIYKTKDGYVRLHTNFPQFVFPSIFRAHSPPMTATNKVYSISCSASLQKKLSRLHSPSGLQKRSKQRCSDGTSAPLRYAHTTKWTRHHMGYSKRTSTPYSSPRSTTRQSGSLTTQGISNMRLKGSVCSI
jgi:hypothetical protein